MAVSSNFISVLIIPCLLAQSFANHNNGIEIETPDKLEYKWLPVKTSSFHFKLRASNDAHVALTSAPEEGNPMLEIFIGGWGNTKSVVRLNRSKPDVLTVDTPGILSKDEYSGFWIRWTDDGRVTVEKEGETKPFMSWKKAKPFKINYVGISTGWGAAGNWLIDGATAKS